MALRIPLLPRPLRWLSTLVVAGVICHGSVIASPPSVPLVVASGSESAIITANVFVPLLEAEIPASYRRHAIAYAALTLSLAYAVAHRDLPTVRKALLVFAVAMGYGVAMELGQLFRPERTATLADVAVNAVGAAIALQWYALEQRARFVPVREIALPNGPTRGER